MGENSAACCSGLICEVIFKYVPPCLRFATRSICSTRNAQPSRYRNNKNCLFLFPIYSRQWNIILESLWWFCAWSGSLRLIRQSPCFSDFYLAREWQALCLIRRWQINFVLGRLKFPWLHIYRNHMLVINVLQFPEHIKNARQACLLHISGVTH